MNEKPTTSIEVDDAHPCVVCGRPTKFVNYCSETRFCSKGCQDKFYTDIAEKNSEY